MKVVRVLVYEGNEKSIRRTMGSNYVRKEIDFTTQKITSFILPIGSSIADLIHHTADRDDITNSYYAPKVPKEDINKEGNL